MIIGVEGIGGSGKTTLIERINYYLRFNYIREARDCTIKKEGLERDLSFLSQHLEVLKQAQSDKTNNFILDRTFLSTLAVMYAKKDAKTGLYKARQLIEETDIKPIDFLVICQLDPEAAIKRRNQRDHFAHPLWSDHDLVSKIDEYYAQIPKIYYKKLIRVNNKSEVYGEQIKEIIGEAHEYLRNKRI